ncbi:hypothetical protein [Reinekea sp. G2M2-21]|uniref:hypothetical protein n=1 Tax=Reinekea sp. G2M2-21 TaxID=2788942 RepID=UPI0018A8C5A9|nr:hypothetical protein [Reinekea sp. G2M2-21]
MSYLTRIQARSQNVRYSVMPKGFVRRAAHAPVEEQQEQATQPLRRQEENTEEQPEMGAQAIHRMGAEPATEEQTEEENAQPLRRQAEEAAEQPEEEEAAQAKRTNSATAVRRAGNEEESEETAQTLRRAEEAQEEQPEEAAPLRRETLEHNEEEAQPLRRAVEAAQDPTEEETAQPRRSVDPNSLTAENSEQPEELSEEPTQPNLTALHREASPSPTPSAPLTHNSATDTHATDTFQHSDFADEGPSGFGLPPQSAFSQSTPTVQIDQIDVLIQEPGSTAGFGQPRNTNQSNRSIRTRYLRRL